jgi:curved DNA-binding protein
MPVYKSEGHFGDLYVSYNVLLPTGLTEAQKALFKQLSELQKS